MLLSPVARLLRTALSVLLRCLVCLLIAVTLGLAAAQRLDLSSPWWLELSRYLPYPVYLGPPLLAIGLSLALGRRWWLASGAALAVTAVWTMDLHWRLAPQVIETGAPRLRVMTYNIKAYLAVGRSGGYDALAREVALRRPDILLLQDASTVSGHPIWDGRHPVFGLPHVFAAQQYVVASRLPLQGCRLRQTRPAYLTYASCTVRVGGQPLNLVTAHLISPRGGLMAARQDGLEGADDWRSNYQLRLLQSRALAADIADDQAAETADGSSPLIVAGDLNAPDASPVVRSLTALGLRDAFAHAGTGYGYSYGQALRYGFSFLRIDHILVSRQIELLGASVGDAETSDHRPVIADLRLPP